MKKFLTLEQMTALRNFGIDVAPKDTGMIYSAVGGEYKLMYSDAVCEDDIIAFDLQDILELLPTRISLSHNGEVVYFLVIEKACNDYYGCYYTDLNNSLLSVFSGKDILDVTCDMVIWVIENKYL